jgi:Planctomycete cytochrome C
LVYSDIITPILQDKCYSCHGPEKQKGKLRLDGKEYILKGGKNGKVISPESAPEPEMLKRILLPPDDEDHMPPKEKRQLTAYQVILISWWLNEGASFTARSKELKQPDTIKNILASLEKGIQGDKQADIAPDIPVLPVAPKELVDSLKKSGAIVLPLSLSVNALSVNLINVTSPSDTLWSQLSRLRMNIYYLNAEGPLIGDDAMKAISTLSQLRKLNLANSSITDEGLIRLKGLDELVSLNLTGTKISEKGLAGLKNLKKLHHIYVYQAGINRDEMEKIRMLLPGVNIETGGYSLPVLSTDTEVVKPKKS